MPTNPAVLNQPAADPPAEESRNEAAGKRQPPQVAIAGVIWRGERQAAWAEIHVVGGPDERQHERADGPTRWSGSGVRGPDGAKNEGNQKMLDEEGDAREIAQQDELRQDTSIATMMMAVTRPYMANRHVSPRSAWSTG